MFSMMISSGMPELTKEEDIRYLQEAFALDMTDASARRPTLAACPLVRLSCLYACTLDTTDVRTPLARRPSRSARCGKPIFARCARARLRV
jgi:hypothetical protein